VPAGNSKSQIAAGDTCERARARARGEDLLPLQRGNGEEGGGAGEERRGEERRGEERRGEEGERDREKAEANGVSWPKDAKLPKRSTRKA